MIRQIFIIGVLALSVFTFDSGLNAQMIDQSSADVEQAVQAQALTAVSQNQVARSQWTVGQYASNATGPASDYDKKTYGAQLFDGGFSGVRSDGLNPNYKIMPGDQVLLRAWGAIQLDKLLPVDGQGNVFIPSIGPVQVKGVSHAQLNAVITEAVKTIYSRNVSVYTELVGVQPIAVYVSGFVKSPGRYAGTPSDSAIYFLHAAGGIINELGSYREVQIIRAGAMLAKIDLYQFLHQGLHTDFQFEDGDTLFVTAKKAMVEIEGDVHLPALFEFDVGSSLDKALIYAQPMPQATGFLIRGYRDGAPYSEFVDLDGASEITLAHGDSLTVVSDQLSDRIVVRVEGSFKGQSAFTVTKDASLKEFLASVPVDTRFADVNSISIKRLSVQKRQRESLQESLRRLETTYMGASSSTAEEATIRIKEAELIQRFVQRAKNIKPSGRLVVSHEDQLSDIHLQDGDVITIPEKSDALLISGEVLVPQSIVFDESLSAKDYIKAAGGFTQHADSKRVLVVRKNGEVRSIKDVDLRGGDEILVLPKAPTKNLQLASTISQILYQIAVAARVVVDL